MTDILYRNTGHNVSSRYKVATTADLLEQFASLGYTVRSVDVSKPRDPAKLGAQKHLVRLQSEQLEFDIPGLTPEIILTNSYDGSTSVGVMLGIYRFVCSNGLIVGDTIASERVRHVGQDFSERLAASIDHVASQVTVMEQEVKQMQSKTLAPVRQLDLAYAVAKPLVAHLEGAEPLAASLVRVNREEDKGADIFTVMNRIQENVLQGNLEYFTSDPEKGLKYRRLRQVRSIDRNVSINRQIWSKALKLAA